MYMLLVLLDLVRRSRVCAGSQVWILHVAKGMLLVDDNTQLSPATLHRNPTNPLTCAITVHEGVFHQIKRMMKQLGSEVAALHRERFGEFTVEGLEEGEMRPMTEKEVTR